MSMEAWLKTYSRRRALRIVSLCGVLAAGPAATAAEVNWQGDVSNNWATGGNWDTGFLPADGDNANLLNGVAARISSDVGAVDNVFISGGTELTLASPGLLGVNTNFVAGSEAGSTGAVVQTGGELSVGVDLLVGDFGDATYAISGGALSTGGQLAIGVEPGVTAEMAISGGAVVQVGASMLVGVGGDLALQEGDTDADGDVDLDDLNAVRNFFGTTGPDDGSLAGDAFPFDGEVNLNDLNGVRNFFGATGGGSAGPTVGVVNQTGGDVLIGVAGDPSLGAALIVGVNASGQGTYNLSGGTLTTGETGAAIGLFGQGEFNMSGNSEFNANSLLLIGNGVYNQEGGNATVVDTTPGGTPIPERLGNATIGDGLGSVGEMNLSGGTLVVASFNSIGSLGGAGTVNVSGDAILATGLALQVGGQSNTTNPGDPLYGAPTSGKLVQTGGEVVAEQLQVASGEAATGLYELWSGQLEVNGLTFIGANSFEFEPGTVTKGDGTYTQSGGEAAFHDTVRVGDDGKGVFSVSEGTATIEASVPDPGFFIPAVALGLFANGEAEFNVSGGEVTLQERIFASLGGNSVINQSGGVLTVNVPRDPGFITPTLMLGNGSAEAVANISGGVTNFNDVVAIGNGGNAHWNQSGGVVTVDQLVDPTSVVPAVIVGNPQGIDAEMNLSGGEFSTTTAFLVGHVSQARGTLNVSDTAHLTVGEEFLVGAFLANSSLAGVVNQSGGTVDVGLAMVLGLQRSGVRVARGTYNMSGGTLNLPEDPSAVTFIIGNSGDGVFEQTGGVVNALGAIGLAFDAASHGTYRLKGGTLEFNQQGILVGDGTATFEFSGGRLSGAALLDLPVTQTGGVLSTGVVPGATEISGDYEISGAATLEIKIGGYIPVDEQDFVQVDSAATLGGELHVELIDGFTPIVGDLFEVLTADGGITGCFDTVTLGGVVGDIAATAICEPDRVIVEIVAADGLLDAGSPSAGDYSRVAHTVIDNSLLRKDWFGVRPVLGERDQNLYLGDMMLRGGTQAVPEPGTLALGSLTLLAGLLAACRGRKNAR